MKKVLCFAAAGLIAAGASAQQSQPQLYGSASYGLLETEVGSTDFDTPTLNLAFGGKFNPNFALEGRLGFGVGDDSKNGVEVEIEDYIGIYAKPILPVSDVISVYGLLGLAETTVDTNFGDDDDDDISYGIGISARLNNGIDLFGEYISLYDDDNVEIGGINLGASMRF
ncbi:porin family protein [Litorivivens sp.]|uniref:porin family protein n=1 Tax=Litorivivens sp. TaxID=2020868 RepID=UPI00356196DF